MSIIESQIKKLIGEASKKSLQSGRLLDISYIAKLITQKIRRLDGGPTLKVRRQYDSLSLNDINTMMDEILFDLEVLYDSLVQKTADLFSIYNNADLSYKAQRSQINYIKGIVNELLLATANAEDNFYGITDNFNTLDKIDLNKTTSGMIDISEGVALLPFGMPSAIRIPMSHLTSISNGTIISSTLKNEKVDSRNGSGSNFGYAFSDISSIWRYEVISKDNTGVKVEITIPLRPDDLVSRITRVELALISGLPISANLLWSLDDQNYRKFVGADTKTVLPNTEKIAWDFPETGLRFIKLQLTKYQPDSGYNPSSAGSISNVALSNVAINTSSVNSYLYNFNVSSIAFYRVGRSIDAVLYSKPIAPFDAPTLPISSLALSVDEEIQPDTSIEYYIATADSNGSIKTDYTRISPLEKQGSYVQNTLTFGNSVKDEVYFTGSYLNNAPTTQNAIDFYPIKTLGSEYKFGACSLYRGAGLFSKNINSNEITKTVTDNYIDFSDGTRTKELYAFKTEIARVINRMVGDGTITKTFLRLSSKIKRSASIKRNLINDPYFTDDPEPIYAIADVKHIRSTMRVEGQPIKPTGGVVNINGASIPIASSWMGYTSSAGSIGVPILYNGQPIDIVNSGFDRPVLKYKVTSFEYVFRDGVDYTIKRSDDDYFQNFAGWNPFPLHWRVIPVEPTTIQVLSGSQLTGQFNNQTGQFVLTGSNLPPVQFGSYNLTSNESLLITYTIDPDITHRVSSVSYDSQEVELDGLISILDGDSISVTYRAVPSKIVKDSVRVTSNYGSNGGTTFAQGIDYSVNTEDGTITKLQGGAITSLVSEVVYVDYNYKDIVDQTISFSAWCYVESRDPIRFDFTPLTLKKSAGEYLLWTYADGTTQTKDISNYSSITLTKGWHYFVVKSLDPASFNDCAITKVLKLRSLTNDYLFLPYDRGGRIFTKIVAYRVPMKQVSFTLLKNGILKSDHSKFAIEDSTKNIFVNFRPSDTDDLYYYRVTSSGVLQLVNFEEFTFVGTRRVDSDFAGTHVLFKARLSRADGSSGGITPKLGSYNIRISY